MALHAGQLCLFEVDEEPNEDLTGEPSSDEPPDDELVSTHCEDSEIDTRSACMGAGIRDSTLADAGSSAEVSGPVSGEELDGVALDEAAPLDPTRLESRSPDAPRQTRGSARRDTNGGRRELVEKHYKTREVAELLSVHEETVLRLAQCGNLRSVRVGSERRYPESAIAEFLKRNADDASVLVARAAQARRTQRARTPKLSRSSR
jgi:excisionase family DNA binding protein